MVKPTAIVSPRCVGAYLFAGVIALHLWTTAEASPRWTGQGAFRILIEVEPVDLGTRSRDELPADVEVDVAALLGGGNAADRIVSTARADITSLQVMRLDASSGEPLEYANYDHARSAFDRPFCWYDRAIPYNFPEVFAPLSYSEGKIKRTISPRAGYMYNALGEWRGGHLAFVHTQDGGEPSLYAVYFDALAKDAVPREAPPRGWLGDGLPRRDRLGDSTTGSDNTIVDLDDWNGDGLVDVVYGEQYGQLFVMPNSGTATAPSFEHTKMLFDVAGQPIDLGIHASVAVIDWDRDGAKDLLVGTYQNRVALLKNVGSNRERRFTYEGFLRTADGEFLALPFRPVAAKPEGVFNHDYYPVMSAVDWNSDGNTDLIAGGYVTGRIYFFEDTSDGAGPLALTLRGPIESDGAPINVRDWCASPCIADFDDDGDLDLISGSYTWLPEEKKDPSFLRYYENRGTRAMPELAERPLPYTGPTRTFRLPVPRASDWNGDGLLDLVVSSGGNIFLFENVGTRGSPRFRLHDDALPTAWGSARLSGRQFFDWNDDGLPDLISGYKVRLNSGAGTPYRFEKTVNVLPPGVHIDHPVATGDGHFFPYLSDLDVDGHPDVLFGDWHGNVWFHRNLSDNGTSRFDVEGRRLEVAGAGPIKVGPIDGDTENDFVALQGARTVLATADFDRDGRIDLVVGDTYGKIRYFRNVGPAAEPRFAAPILVGDMGFRLLVDAADWDGDGRVDVIAGTASHRVSVFLNESTEKGAAFSEEKPLKLPPIKETRVLVVDLNRDGDQDLFVMSTQGTILVERSFIRHGYARGRILKLERKPPE